MIQAGFEFEFGHDVRTNLITQVIKHHFPDNKIYVIDDEFEEYKLRSKHYFIFKTDISVNVYGCKYANTEMTTPVFIGKKAILESFKKIFDILRVLDVKTDNSCSVHINVSFTEDEETQRINLGKMYVFINELQQLKIFGRGNNVYCKQCISRKRCMSIIRDAKNDNDLIKRLEKYLLLSAEEHHQAIAFDKQENKELYITEFRFIGGDYIDKFEDANKILNTTLDAMYFAIGKNKKNNISDVLKKFKFNNRLGEDLKE